MEDDKFASVLTLIREIFRLIADLVPVADDALDLIGRIRQIVADYKATKEEVSYVGITESTSKDTSA